MVETKGSTLALSLVVYRLNSIMEQVICGGAERGLGGDIRSTKSLRANRRWLRHPVPTRITVPSVVIHC
jgi:hypothetical protein